ncbi:MAG: 5-formyltetrahydrofolate cyclo-ligase [Betaproteobacteria bacterium]|nr:5-formyltetrahydrofolate cyclo-ligase [Betaproteobacteria bacterium]
MSLDPVPSAEPLSGPALHEAKRAVRERILAARDALPAADRDEGSRAIAARIAALPPYARARCVLLTVSFRSEWDTRALIDAALAAGKVVALPRVNGATRMLDLHAVADVARETTPGYRGIPEPRPEQPRVDLAAVDFVLVPGVAFDPTGRRLGYGGGYYDRLLALLAPEAARIAGAFELQLVPQVPAAPHDLFVDAIVTPVRMVPGARGVPSAA